MKICRVATVPFFLFNHLRQQIVETVARGHEVVLISGNGDEIEKLRQIYGVRFVQIEIRRQISPLHDLVSLWRLYRQFKSERFDIVHTTTPKAGFLGAIAAFFAKVPTRLHTFTGQAWAETKGTKRAIAKLCDKVIVLLNTRCYADSFSQREFLIREGIGQEPQICVLGLGSLAGVDLQRFSKKASSGARQQTLQTLNIPEQHRIITFIGRVTKDKGIRELIESFQLLQKQGIPCSLLLIGPEEEDAQQIFQMLRLNHFVHIYRLGYQSNPEKWLAITDVLCLPSYREGFGNVVIEAAAMGIPTVGTDIPGLRDSVRNYKTGILVPTKNTAVLAKALLKLVCDNDLRVAMGDCAHRRVQTYFDSRLVNTLILNEYEALHKLQIDSSPH